MNTWLSSVGAQQKIMDKRSENNWNIGVTLNSEITAVFEVKQLSYGIISIDSNICSRMLHKS